MKLIELKEQAKKRGVVGYYKMNKQQLIDILSLPEVESMYEKTSMDEQRPDKRPDVETQKNIAVIGGVTKKSALQEYLDSVVSVPIPDILIEKMSKSKLQSLDKKGTKIEMFRNILRKEITGLLLVL